MTYDRARRAAQLKSRYGLSLDEYEQMEKAQGNRCAICGRRERGTGPKSGTRRHLAVDHDHDTHEVRGLLCLRCNRAVGLMEDNPLFLIAAGHYLLRHLSRKG